MRNQMPTTGLGKVFEHLRRSLPPPGNADLTDNCLLEQFLLSGDEAAFAALVQRRRSYQGQIDGRHVVPRTCQVEIPRLRDPVLRPCKVCARGQTNACSGKLLSP